MGRAEKGPVSITFSSLNTMQSALTFHRERHTVLAGNIANLDTPGYKPLDLQRSTPTEGTTLSVTADGHISPIGRRLLELPLHPRLGRLVTRGAEQADAAEVATNPRAASVRLRAVERIKSTGARA
jgi:flagellar basal body rod protein FlgB